MTRWADERIPIWVPPIVGEALDSWLEAYARRLRVTASEFLHFLGLPDPRENLMVRRLTGRERDVLARTTGIPPDELATLTLEPWDGSVVSIDPDDRSLGRPRAWRHYGNHTRYCPACLHESQGRWQLAWRLPWSFACVRHGVLLLDHCPKCGREPPVNSRGHVLASQPGICLARMGTGIAIRCGFALAEAPCRVLPDKGLVLAAQHSINRTVLGAEPHASTVRQQAQELYALARRTLRTLHSHLPTAPAVVRTVLNECGGVLPTLVIRHEGNDAHNAAIGTALARVVHEASEPAHSELLRWLLDADRDRRDDHGRINRLQDWAPAGPQVTSRVLAAVDSELALLSRIRYGSATPAPAWTALSDALDEILRGHDPTPLVSTLALLARALDTHPTPIDYGRRRAVFHDGTVELDMNAYQELCRRHGYRRPGVRQIQHIRWHLLSLLLGANPGNSSCAPFWQSEFRYRLQEDLQAFLHHQAAANLAAHGIAEPVRWEPPAHWLSRSVWPGIPPEAVDPAAVSALAATRRPAETAQELGLGQGHLQLFLESTGTTALSLPAQRPNGPGRTIPRQGFLAPLQLRELYEVRRLEQQQIAALAECSTSTVHLALHEAGIPLRPRRKPRELEQSISREWLENEYLHKRRSPAQIARELGTHGQNVYRLIYQWDIPRIGRGWVSNPFATLDVLLSPAMFSISTTKDCLPRLRNIVQLPGHRNIHAAEIFLGVSPGTIRAQLNRIESTVGFTVLERTCPLATTPKGQDLFTEANRLLALLDRHSP